MAFLDNYKNKIKKISAFTLAEVLITLGIIGVVAAITIPVIQSKIQDEEHKTAYKKAYSVLYQAFLKASQEGDIVPLMGTNSSVGSEENFAAIKKQFIVTKECTGSNISECWDITTGEHWRSDDYNVPAFIDNSGYAWKLRGRNAWSLNPAVLVDINGLKKPNKYGQDRFPFLFAKTNSIEGIGNDMGIPTRINPYRDITVYVEGSNSDAAIGCLSVVDHPCYYRSWLFGGK